MTNISRDYCDGCEQPYGTSYRLDLGGGAGVYLCRTCWGWEMHWREEMNQEVAHPYPILPFPGKGR